MVNVLALFLASCLIGGCVARPIANEEPDTEWIIAQYQGQDEAVVNARRIKEGW